MSNILNKKYYINEKEVSSNFFKIVNIIRDECYKQKNTCKNCDCTNVCIGLKGIPSRMKLRVKYEEPKPLLTTDELWNKKVNHRGFEVVKDEHRKHSEIEIELPKRGSKYSAGYDIHTPIKIIIPAGGISEAIQTDVKAYMLDDEVLEIYPRSSLGFKKGLMLINTVGIIDSDYYSNNNNDGNIGFKLKNLTDEDVVIEAGEKIMQGIFKKYLMTSDDNTTKNRVGGIGSTGN